MCLEETVFSSRAMYCFYDEHKTVYIDRQPLKIQRRKAWNYGQADHTQIWMYNPFLCVDYGHHTFGSGINFNTEQRIYNMHISW